MVPLGGAGEAAKGMMDEYQGFLLKSAQERLAAATTIGATYAEMKSALGTDEASTYPGAGMFLVPWKCSTENEEKVKDDCKATIRCYPLDVNEMGMAEGKECFFSGEPATHMALFARAY